MKWRLLRRLAVSVIALLLPRPSTAFGQCPYGAWSPTAALRWVENAYSYGAQINAVTVWDPDGPGPRDPVLVVGGGHFSPTLDMHSQARNVALWDGSTWNTLGLGLNNMGGYGEGWAYVWALTVWRGDVYAGGDFSYADGAPAHNLARWDGSNWMAAGLDVNGSVLELTTFRDRLIVAGSFTQCGGVAASNIASWNGTSWQPLGSGLDGTVRAVYVLNDKLYVGGAFTHSGPATLNHIAAWNGAAWETVGPGQSGGPGLPGSVTALGEFQGQLAVGGSSRLVNDWGDLSNILLLDPAGWNPLGTGTSDPPSALVSVGTLLYVVGSFTSAGGISVNHIAVWDADIGFDWDQVEEGVPWWLGATVHNHELVVGGTERVHRWVNPTPPPYIAQQPSPVTVATETMAFMHVSAAATSAVFYQWRRNGANLTDGDNVSGARQSTLVLSPVLEANAGTYTCAITSACGNLTSIGALLTVTPACGSADFNHDGDVGTDADLEAFFACLAGSCCASCGSADFNGDGDVGTDADILSFFSVLGGGPC